MEGPVHILYLAAGAIYLAYFLLEAAGIGLAGTALGAAALTHALMLATRGVAIRFFPLTNKFESFTCFSLALVVVLIGSRARCGRLYRIGLFAPAALFYGLASLFPMAVTYPPPLMLTIWYPLHVPLSFLAYAFWGSAAVAAIAGPATPAAAASTAAAATGGPGGDPMVASHILWGYLLWSLSMFFGGLWGYVAWGHHFLWDQKILWSVILWIFYSVVIHLDQWPALARSRDVFAVLGFVFSLVTYVGTSFLTGSSHSFR